MSKHLSEWMPSEASIEVVKKNGVTDEQIAKSVEYLKNQADLHNIDDIDGYDNWNSFFIVFCIKAKKTHGES